MLKSNLIIVSSHIKNAKYFVSLHQVSLVIINITKFPFIVFRKIHEGKRFPSFWKPFFYAKKFQLSTI